QGGASCAGTVAPVATMPAHSSADGLAFVTGEWGARYGTSAFVALFGSSFEPPTGHSVARIALTPTPDGYAGRTSTFATGFDTPLAVATRRGALLVGDFGRGVVYRLRPRG
ncbi:MAG: hypothetical protein AB1416_10550, partial [Actinomycetota bacterium]